MQFSNTKSKSKSFQIAPWKEPVIFKVDARSTVRVPVLFTPTPEWEYRTQFIITVQLFLYNIIYCTQIMHKTWHKQKFTPFNKRESFRTFYVILAPPHPQFRTQIPTNPAHFNLCCCYVNRDNIYRVLTTLF